MRSVVLLTNSPARSQRLNDLSFGRWQIIVVDVLDPDLAPTAIDPASVAAVISDVPLANSVEVGSVRRYLTRFGAGDRPYFCILHEESPRAHAQAHALGASRVISARDPFERIAALLAEIVPSPKPVAEPAPASAVVTAAAGAAQSLTRLFDLGRAGQAPNPALLTEGATLVLGALDQADIRGWLDVVWRFDNATHQHCLLVAGLAAGFGRHLGLKMADCRALTEAALLHDLGKAQIPHAILNKPGRLDPAEQAVMRTHPDLGHAMLLEQGGFPEIMLAVVRSHHEALDGSGYPDGLEGPDIPDLVRLVTICDIYGALIERRPYKAPLDPGEAYGILAGMVGKVDRDLVRAFGALATASGPGHPVPVRRSDAA
ncbi:HD domain-containing phosphohydrolase [Methylobacterium sp. Leaf89]|uniref:HD-GYP domain-containing protein n=1 Tax=Methylobacterium sp. Leaf89 TaxID=1736245 RepID=UPI0006FB3F42|nr:HD domain-containing phosphohydrolase [Methylobacterium sp. Leaf89]